MSEALSEKLGYRFKDQALLARALTHAGANSAHSNERLEFLGDRVLALVVSQTLYHRYPHEDEGALTRRVHALVRWETCAKVGEDIGLWEHLLLTRSESAGGRARGPIMGSACEAVIAALYLDGGMEAARAFIERYWETMFSDSSADIRDAKTRLQEWAQARGKSSAAPVYSLQSQAGPDHAPYFVVQAEVKGFDPVTGEGGSKRQAEQDAAAKLLAIVAPKDGA
ncbi:MAG TPA: ribonuclease III [Rhizomicrobium sp.]|nr:ribonuclease III [Rhizomicrobium sp.]